MKKIKQREKKKKKNLVKTNYIVFFEREINQTQKEEVKEDEDEDEGSDRGSGGGWEDRLIDWRNSQFLDLY